MKAITDYSEMEATAFLSKLSASGVTLADKRDKAVEGANHVIP